MQRGSSRRYSAASPAGRSFRANDLVVERASSDSIEVSATNFVMDAEREGKEASLGSTVSSPRKRRRVSGKVQFGEQIRVSVGGEIFSTTKTTLSNSPFFAAIFSGRHRVSLSAGDGEGVRRARNGNQGGSGGGKRAADGEDIAVLEEDVPTIFVDRDGIHFRDILNWLRGVNLPISTWTLAKRLAVAEEAAYYGLDGLKRRSILPAWTKRCRKGAIVWWVDQIATGDPRKYHWHRSIVSGWKDRQRHPSLLVVGPPLEDPEAYKSEQDFGEPVGVTMSERGDGTLVAAIRFRPETSGNDGFYKPSTAQKQMVIDIESDDLRVLCVECGPSPYSPLQHRRTTALGNVSTEHITMGPRLMFVEFKLELDKEMWSS